MIRAFQWHPHCMKYAVAYQNDVVNIYSANQAKIVLKHPKQINVTCLAWKYVNDYQCDELIQKCNSTTPLTEKHHNI